MPTIQVDGTIKFPLAAEADLSSRPFSSSLVYTERSVVDHVFSGAVADIDIMGLITDAKASFVEMIAGQVDLKINGATPILPLTSGSGFWLWFNPNGGLTGLTATTAAAASLRLYLFT